MKRQKSRTSLFSKAAIVAITLSLSAAQANAATVETETSTEASVEGAGITFTGRVGVGYLNGEANEYVYWEDSGGRTASKLTWKIDSLYMAGLGVTIQPSHWVNINVDTWFNVGDGDGYMSDYDWMEPAIQDWTDESLHDDTNVTKGFIFDVNAEMTAFSNDQISLTGILGFRRDNFEWEARGGTYVYSAGGFRNRTGSFPAGELGITYEQTFNVPYFGVGFKGDFDRVHLGVKLIGSIFVNGEAVDQHHMRDLVTYDDFSGEQMWGFDLAFGYDISDRMGVEMTYAYEKYDTMKGDSVWHYNDEGVIVDLPNGAGADLQTSMAAVNFIYSF